MSRYTGTNFETYFNNSVFQTGQTAGIGSDDIRELMTALKDSFEPNISVDYATTANITLSGSQTFDGYTPAVGTYVLAKDQTTSADRGIYIVAAGAWTLFRAFAQGDFIKVSYGTVNAGRIYIPSGPTNCTRYVLSSTDTVTANVSIDASSYAALQGIATTSLSVGALRSVATGYNGSDVLDWYELQVYPSVVSETQSLPYLVKPTDYNASTNRKMWKLIGSGSGVFRTFYYPSISSSLAVGDPVTMQSTLFYFKKVSSAVDIPVGIVVGVYGTDYVMIAFSGTFYLPSSLGITSTKQYYIQADGTLSTAKSAYTAFVTMVEVASTYYECQMNIAPAQSPNTDLSSFDTDDFNSADAVLSYAISGTGSFISASTFGVDSTENAQGVIYLTTGTTTSGIATWKKSQIANLLFGISEMTLLLRTAIGVLSDGTNTFTVYVGFGDTDGSGDMVNGAYFKYTHGTNSGKWQAVTADTSTRTATDTGITADTTFHVFEIRVNKTGNSVDFYIDGTVVVSNQTTNIPGSGKYLYVLTKIEKSAGTTARLIYDDWYSLKSTRSSAR